MGLPLERPRFDVTSLGEAMVRLSVPKGRRLASTYTLDVHVGGAESNVCAALSGLGRRCGWVSRVPDNPPGELVLRALREAGVDLSAVKRDGGARQALYFVEFSGPPRPTEVTYDRTPSAAASMSADSIDWNYLLDTRLLHLTGITPALSESCASLITEAVARATSAGIPVSFDVNYRGRLWSASEAGNLLRPIVRSVELLFCGIADAKVLFDLKGEPRDILLALATERSGRPTVLTLGSRGAMALYTGKVLVQNGVTTEVLDKLGAGDAFAAGVIDGWLEGSMEKGLEQGVALASLAASQDGDMVVSSRKELEAILSRDQAVIQR
ncbi:MAG: sugar kinase [Trueperaceae bacterium]